jgi:hypothetical protein
MNPTIVLKNFISMDVNRFLSFFSKGPIFAAIQKNEDGQCFIYLHYYKFLDLCSLQSVVYLSPVFEHMLLFLSIIFDNNAKLVNRTQP